MTGWTGVVGRLLYARTRIVAFPHGRAVPPPLLSLSGRTKEGQNKGVWRVRRLALTRLTGNGNGECGEKDCPNVYRTVSGSFVVQGDVSDAFTPPAREGLVEIPEAVLREAFHALGW